MKIALCGKMASGKTYISNLLIDKYNLEKYSFADKIKDIANDLFKCQYKNRELLQNIADKMKEIDNDIWVKYILSKIEKKDNIIIDDLRFKNELNYLKKYNFIIIGLEVDDTTQTNRLKDIYKSDYINHLLRKNHNSEILEIMNDVDYKVQSNENTFNNILKFLDKK